MNERPDSRAPRAPRRRWPVAAATALVLFTLGGCASLNTVDSDVRSYGQWPGDRAIGRYAFERLPSQAAEPERQSQLESAARPALTQAGFTEAATKAEADVVVQLGARVDRQDRGVWDDPFWWNGWGYRGRWAPGWGYYRPGPFWSMGYAYESPRYEREVGILIRDAKTGQPLYESRATNDSLTRGDADTLSAMYTAALKDFPTPAVNPRRVSVPLGPVTP